MRRPLYCLLMLFVMAFVACEQDAYDKGDASYSYMRADFVEANVGSDKRIVSVLTDDDVQLPLTTPYSANWIQRADTVYRAVLYYNLNGQQAETVSLQRVATATIRTFERAGEGVKTDPLKLESIWLSKNKKYLNLSVIVKTGLMDADGTAQTLGVVGDTILVGADSLRTYHLRLSHGQGDVPQYYSQRVYFSVPVGGLEVDSLRLTVNTYDGVVAKGFRL